MLQNKLRGFTLIDLIFAMSIFAILFGFALPSFDVFLDKRKLVAESLQLRAILQLARKTAITQHKKVTICPVNNTQTCSQNWSKGYMVFIDENENRELDVNEKIIYHKNINNSDFQVRWKAFGRKTSLQWHQTGITNHQNGSFELCLKQNPQLTRALIITKAGRIRSSKDKNKDGIHENSQGVNLSC